MKKSFLGTVAILAAMSMAVLTGCGSSTPTETKAAGGDAKTEAPAGGDAAASDWTWERNIEIVCPWGTGGGADTTLRAFATALESEIGVKVVVNNKSGAGGVTGVQFASSQPADGYTYLLCTQSPMLAQITGATDFDVYGSVKPLCQLVHDVNVFVAGKDEPYNNMEELKEYLKANPGSVKCGVMTITGLDAACVQGAFDGEVEAVAYTEGSQLNADIVGGHINLGCEGPAEVSAMVESGDMKVIGACTDQHLTLAGWENVQTTADINNETTYGPARGIFYIPGTPDAAIKAFEAAAEKAVASDSFQEFCKQQGLDQRQGWLNTADYTAEWDSDYQNLTALFGNK
ncbi:Tripartite-type tricarboxylate transporter, receptor component TctC [Oribacterium sp. KHPX15]|uniref:Bug family tripartite tricarboxylate transporter substrate binding protein n=1 Tax=Oribacterium sp. KHPX15 TaxID=1855342 RepID=UPI00089CE5EC|nr:tripartite tricarboxylate transporter substrate-binding protein [Oribacterium sp. KHPX15]SEA55309.1 Tripartite-type tricarboxylate transporter, receptor component TctC [Oribacterium sp. KHPX15]